MDSVFSGVSNWLSCGSNAVDRWFFGEGEDETSSSSSGEEGNVSSDDSSSSGETSSGDDDSSAGKNKSSTTNRRNRKKASNAGVGVVSPGNTSGNSNSNSNSNQERIPQMYSWGYNYFGQCCHSDQPSIIQLPTRVEQLINMQLRVLAMASGDSHVLAIVHPGNQVYAWGCNRWGQLGMGDQTNRVTPTPIAISTPTVFTAVSCGAQHSMALSSYGELYSWGCGTGGRIGHGTEAPSLIPQVISGLVGKQITSMAGGMLHSAAIDSRGSVYTWGWNKYGQLGNNTSRKQLVPSRLREMDKHQFVKVTCGKNHTHLLTLEGHVYSFGFNVCGQLGVGGYADSPQPKKVELPEHAIDIVSGYYHTLCLTNRGNVYSWGYMSDGALGLGDVAGHQSKPKLIPLSHIRHNYSDSIDSYNSIYQENGSSGEQNPKYSKGDVVEKIAAGAWNSAIITNSGKLYCFGFGDSYRIGNGINSEDQDIPCLVNGDEWGIDRLIQVAESARNNINIDQIMNDIKNKTLDKRNRITNTNNNNSNQLLNTQSTSTNTNNNINNNNNNTNNSTNKETNRIGGDSPSVLSMNHQPTEQQHNKSTNLDQNNNNPTSSSSSLSSSIIVKVETKVTNVSIGSGFTFAIVKHSINDV